MIVAVDVGGTKTLVADFDSDGTPGKQARFLTPHNEMTFLTELINLIKENYPDPSEIDALCIGLPGRIRDTELEFAANLGWKHIAIQEQLSEHLKCPIYVENDANLAGLAESRQLGDRDHQGACLYITISTGIGTGVIVNGAIDTSLHQSEGGHMILEYQGKLQEWEAFASGKSIHEIYGKYAHDIKEQSVWNEIADRISRGLLALIPVIRPNAIIIGGSIGTYFESYYQKLEEIIRSHLSPPVDPPTILPARHPEEAVIYGCYYYAVAQLTH